MEWLGFQIDLSVGEFSVPLFKIDALKAKLLEVQEARYLPASQLASLIGRIISMSLTLGLVTRLMIQNLYASVTGYSGYVVEYGNLVANG